jgi:PAS domain S-box-containing protein
MNDLKPSRSTVPLNSSDQFPEQEAAGVGKPGLPRVVTLRAKLLVGFTVVFGVVSAATYFWFYRFTTNKVLQNIQQELVDTMNAAAEGVDGDDLLQLAQQATRNEDGYTDDPRYWEHVEWLATVEHIEPRAYVYTYIAGPEPNTILFIGSGSALNRDRDFQGATFKEFYQPETRIYEGLSRQVINTEPYHDPWGYWITGYTPITNGEGEAVAGLGVDFQAQYVLDVQWAVRDRILVAFLLTYGVLVVMVYGLSGSLTSYLTRITQAAQDIGKGHYEPGRLPARSPRMADELDTLVQVLRSMVSNIRQREQFLKAILEDQTECICRFLPDGTLSFVNEAYARDQGQCHDQLIGANFITLVPPEHQDALQQKLEQLTLEHPVEVWEYKQEYPEQETEWHQWTIRALFTEEGQLKEFQAVGRNISRQKQAEIALLASEARYRALVEQIPAVTYISDLGVHGQTLYISPQVETMFGDTQTDWLTHPDMWLTRLHPADRDRILPTLNQSFAEHDVLFQEYRILNRVGEEIWVRDNAIVLADELTHSLLFQGVMFDITAHKQAEAQLQSMNAELEHRVEQRTLELAQLNQALDQQAQELKLSLEEKDLLLKEVHHRVKNNLQVISSLLSLQAQYIQDEDVLSALADSRSRIRSMALIHEKLYQSPSLARVDFADYIDTLVGHLATTYSLEARYSGDGATSSRIRFALHVDNVALGIDAAIPCGLLINELVSNSLKYAFPDGAGGAIAIHFTPAAPNHLQLIVRDTGVGLPPNIGLEKPTSLGLRLVKALTRQLRGQANLFNDHGTVCQITFPVPPERAYPVNASSTLT